jgi:type I restriction enzyme R subunit
LKTYTDSKGKGRPTLDNHEAFSIMLEKLEVIQTMLDGFDYADFEKNALKLSPKVMNNILSLESPQGKLDGKKRFFDVMATLIRAYTLCGKLDGDKNSAMKQIIDNTIVAEGVTDIFESVGLDKPNIGLLSEEFLEDIKQNVLCKHYVNTIIVQ